MTEAKILIELHHTIDTAPITRFVWSGVNAHSNCGADQTNKLWSA